MSKKCPNCSEELKDDAMVCENCGHQITPDDLQKTEPVTEPETAPEAETAAETEEENTEAIAEEGTVEEAFEAEEKAADEDETDASAEAGTEAEAESAADAQPAAEEAPAKKPLSFGLGLGIGIGIAVLVAAILGVFMFLSNSSDSAKSVESYINAYKEAEYEDYFSHDYTVMFKSNDLESRIEAAEQYSDPSQTAGLQAKVIKEIKLSEGVKNSIMAQLEAGEYADTDKIEDIRIVLLEVSNTQAAAATAATDATDATEASDSAARDYWISSFYAIKVGGDWYFTTGF